MNTPQELNIDQWLWPRIGLFLTVLLIIAAFNMSVEHGTRVFGILTYVLWLQAILMLLLVRAGQDKRACRQSIGGKE